MSNKEKIKDMVTGEDVTKSLSNGIKKIIESVGVTLGPRGQNVLIDSGHPAAPSTITKDGVTVIRNLVLNDYVENLAVKTIREASEKTVDECGDGTTTTAILASAIYLEGLKLLATKRNPISIKRGIDKVAQKLQEKLDEIKIEVTTDDQIRNVATISANGDEEIGSLIVQALDKVGKDGMVTVENGKTFKDELITTDGLRIERGYASPYFITNPVKNTAELDNPLIVVTDYEFQTANDLIPILEIAHSKSRPLLIIAEGGSAEAIQTLILNKIKGVVNVCAIDAPGFGERKKELLQDIATVVGAEFITEDLGIELDQITYEMLGSADKIIATKNETTIINGKGDENAINERKEQIKNLMEEADNDYDKEFYKDRLAKLNGGVAIIRVGGNSEVEVEEKKDRIDDALGATRAAIEDGIVIGGGCALLHAAELIEVHDLDIKNDDEAAGVHLFLEAIKQPLKLITENAGGSPDYVVSKIIENLDEKNYGYDASTSEFGDLFEKGIIDPVKVTKSAIKNAVSVATLLLSSKTILMKQNQIKAIQG